MTNLQTLIATDLWKNKLESLPLALLHTTTIQLITERKTVNCDKEIKDRKARETKGMLPGWCTYDCTVLWAVIEGARLCWYLINFSRALAWSAFSTLNAPNIA